MKLITRCRWAACWIGFLATASAAAQVSDPLDQPTRLPPLLTPPTGDPNARPPAGPRGPAGEYDHGHLYLPESVPQTQAPEACRPLGKWWVAPTFEFAWLPTRPAPGAVRLRVPDGAGGSIPGPILPVAGRAAREFQGGFGLAGGWWFGEANERGVEASLFTTSGGDRTFDGFAPGMLVLFPGGTDRSAPQVVVFPAGTPVIGIFPNTLSTWFISADVNYRRNIYCTPNARLDALAGYRFASLEDELFVGERPGNGRTDYERNRIAVSNPFHGGQVGLTGEYWAGDWFLAGTAKSAFGVVAPEVCATGLFAGTEGETAGGFARLAAVGRAVESRFAVLPTVNVQVGKQLHDHSRLFAGYSIQYLSRVARLGDVLDPAAAAVPVADFWVQSFNLGLEWRY